MSSRRASPAISGGFFVAHHHGKDGGIADDIEAVRSMKPELLWSFMGTVANYPVRRKLLDLVDERSIVRDTQDWHDRLRWTWDSENRAEGRVAFKKYASLVGHSAFVVCPRGFGASSIRLFEALQAGRCPVILSDDWIAPPFVDWESCSIRIAEGQVDRLPEILAARGSEAAELGRQARSIWERFFSPARQLQTLIAVCMAVEQSPAVRGRLLVRAMVQADSARWLVRRVRSRTRPAR